MKFTKEQLSEALKAGITNNGKKNLAMSERSFNEEVEDIYADLGESGNNEELELADAVGKKINAWNVSTIMYATTIQSL